MDKLAFGLVALSVFSHAYWNYLVKTSGRKHIFISLSKISQVLMFGIPYVLAGTSFLLPPAFYSLVVVTAILTGLNYYFIARAFEYGELSLVYPVSRCGILFIPMIAFVLIRESISLTGWLAMTTILFGSIVMHMEQFNFRGLSQLGQRLNNRGTAYAFLAALALAMYTVVGKVSVQLIEPLVFFISYTLLTATGYATVSFSGCTRADVVGEWNENWRKILQVGFFDGCTFLMVLLGLQLAKASQVGGLRQVGLVVGVFFGHRFLNEKISISRIAGALISICGGIIFLFEE